MRSRIRPPAQRSPCGRGDYARAAAQTTIHPPIPEPAHRPVRDGGACTLRRQQQGAGGGGHPSCLRLSARLHPKRIKPRFGAGCRRSASRTERLSAACPGGQSIQASPEGSAHRRTRTRRRVMIGHTRPADDHEPLTSGGHSRGGRQKDPRGSLSDHRVSCARHHQQSRACRNAPAVYDGYPGGIPQYCAPRIYRVHRRGGGQAAPGSRSSVVGGKRCASRVTRHDNVVVGCWSAT